MKNKLVIIGILYVFAGAFVATDLNPLLLWEPYQNFVQAFFDTMSKIHRGLPLLWLFSWLMVTALIKCVLEADSKSINRT